MNDDSLRNSGDMGFEWSNLSAIYDGINTWTTNAYGFYFTTLNIDPSLGPRDRSRGNRFHEGLNR